MTYLRYNIDLKQSAYGRLAMGVLGVLRAAVSHRVEQGKSKSEIANRADISPGHLSRILNGNVSNLTLRTVSDLLWASDYDPQDFTADPVESLQPNGGAKDTNMMPSGHLPARTTASGGVNISLQTGVKARAMAATR